MANLGPFTFGCTCRFTRPDEFSPAEFIEETICGYHAKMRDSARPEVACSGETPRTDALIASKPGLWREWKDSDFHALSQHAGQMERLAKRWQKIADQRAIEVADLKTSVPSPLARSQEPEKCPECGHGNRLNGRIVHGVLCSQPDRNNGSRK